LRAIVMQVRNDDFAIASEGTSWAMHALAVPLRTRGAQWRSMWWLADRLRAPAVMRKDLLPLLDAAEN
jgi:hypothetical protein